MSTPQASAAPGPAPTRWVRVGQAAWIVTALLSVGLVAADYPYRFDQLRAYCLTVCEAGRLPPSEAPALARLGLTLDAYAAYTIALYLALTLVCWGVSVLLTWRKSGESTALLAAVCLLALGPSTGLTLATVLPGGLSSSSSSWPALSPWSICSSCFPMAVLSRAGPAGRSCRSRCGWRWVWV